MRCALVIAESLCTPDKSLKDTLNQQTVCRRCQSIKAASS